MGIKDSATVQQLRKAVQEVEENQKVLRIRHESIEKELLSLNEKLIAAQEFKRKTIARGAIDENMQPEIEKTKVKLKNIEESISDRKEMLFIISQKIAVLQKQLDEPFTGLRAKLLDASRSMWQSLHAELIEDLYKTIGPKLEECFSVYKESGGMHNIRAGHYLSEIFDKLEPSFERQQEILKELSRKYGI